jgi:hypothetical protein
MTIENPPRKESPSYPGIQNENTILSAIVTLSDEQYNPEGYIESQSKKNTYFKWNKKS